MAKVYRNRAIEKNTTFNNQKDNGVPVHVYWMRRNDLRGQPRFVNRRYADTRGEPQYR